ncbi:MAG: hypothetical protein WCD42_00390 [Rhizomicrobium sp.]
MSHDDEDDDKTPRFYIHPADIAPLLGGLFIFAMTLAMVYFFYFRPVSPFEILIPKEKPTQYVPKPIQGMMPAAAVTGDDKASAPAASSAAPRAAAQAPESTQAPTDPGTDRAEQPEKP